MSLYQQLHDEALAAYQAAHDKFMNLEASSSDDIHKAWETVVAHLDAIQHATEARYAAMIAALHAKQ